MTKMTGGASLFALDAPKTLILSSISSLHAISILAPSYLPHWNPAHDIRIWFKTLTFISVRDQQHNSVTRIVIDQEAVLDILFQHRINSGLPHLSESRKAGFCLVTSSTLMSEKF
jgi:hypothetical protein